jgi:hypothetical protein
MGSVLVRCGSRLISVNLDENNVSGIGTIAQHIESYDARLVSTGNRVLLRSGKEGIKLIGQDRNVDMNKKEAVRHEQTLFDQSRRSPRCDVISSAAARPYASSKRVRNLSPKRYSCVPTTSIA